MSDNRKTLRAIVIGLAGTACFGLCAHFLGWLSWPKLLILAACVTIVNVAGRAAKAYQSRTDHGSPRSDSAEPAPRPREGDSGSEWNRSPRLH
ncbi:hypothetical protein Pen02_52070 [Plantactinospora endophytica]|uniref:Uncharacterized protein n=2 Tax=Plantactinospora endophytica TaxID=673535 RepID=A0ABQ4E7J3_9ACTN|nr:hypothetical protein Pen02_52070 [Plantactinospora endophytica]